MTDTDKQLWRHAGELAASSAFLMYLAEAGSQRLSLHQMTFFMLAAAADAAGRPATRTQIMEAASGLVPGMRNTYRQLLPPSRVFPKALGWLVPEENPMDGREALLRLSPEGVRVIEGALLTLRPLKGAKAE